MEASKRKENAKLVRLDDEHMSMLLALADRKGIPAATLMRSYIHKCLAEDLSKMNLNGSIGA